MVVDAYIEDLEKLALALTSAQLAKSTFVTDEGIGEDIAFNFFFWKENKVALIMQLNKKLMALDHKNRFVICADACIAIRQYWGVDAITMVAEGWCSPDPEKTKGLELDREFAKKDSSVMECITLTHAENGEEREPYIQLMACPYKYSHGRIVEFSDPMYYSEGGGKVLRDRKYPAMLIKALLEEPLTGINDDTKDEVLDNLHHVGIYSQDFGL